MELIWWALLATWAHRCLAAWVEGKELRREIAQLKKDIDGNYRAYVRHLEEMHGRLGGPPPEGRSE